MERQTKASLSEAEQLKSIIRNHLENSKIVDSLKSEITKDQKFSLNEKNHILQKLKTEGILSSILKTIPKKKFTSGVATGGGTTFTKTAGREVAEHEEVDPKKRYLSVQVQKGAAFVDFINPREDEWLLVTVSFLKGRSTSKPVLASTDPLFNHEALFEFEKPREDPTSMVRMKAPVMVIVQRQRRNEKPVVLANEHIDWRILLHSNSVEMNIELKPVDLKHKGSIGAITINLDLHPYLAKNELLPELSVTKQQDLEKKYDAEETQKFLDYANDWWKDYKEIKPGFKNRLVKLFAQTDDRNNNPYVPVCALIYPLRAEYLIDSPNHAARFVSLIPF